MTRDEATQRKMECDITVGPVNTVAESLADPQIHAGEMVEE
jgi:crotonobetainyl-CoA:carnitine CoA-transferase CaiB-like acyl-CoA transferase